MQEMWEKQVQSLGGEDPLEEEMATHSCILAWRIPWTEEPGRVNSQTQLKQLSMQDSRSFSFCYKEINVLLHMVTC